MKKNWKSIVLYVIRVIELILTGAAGGAASQVFRFYPQMSDRCYTERLICFESV